MTFTNYIMLTLTKSMLTSTNYKLTWNPNLKPEPDIANHRPLDTIPVLHVFMFTFPGCSHCTAAQHWGDPPWTWWAGRTEWAGQYGHGLGQLHADASSNCRQSWWGTLRCCGRWWTIPWCNSSCLTRMSCDNWSLTTHRWENSWRWVVTAKGRLSTDL